MNRKKVPNKFQSLTILTCGWFLKYRWQENSSMSLELTEEMFWNPALICQPYSTWLHLGFTRETREAQRHSQPLQQGVKVRPPFPQPSLCGGLSPNHIRFFKPLTPCFLPFVPGCLTPHPGPRTLACTCRGTPSSSPRWGESWSTNTTTARPLTMTLPCCSSVSPGLRPWSSSFSQYASLLPARKCAVERSAGWPAGGAGTKQVCVSECPPLPSRSQQLLSMWCFGVHGEGFCIWSHLSLLTTLIDRLEESIKIPVLWCSPLVPQRSENHFLRECLWARQDRIVQALFNPIGVCYVFCYRRTFPPYF